MSEQVTAGTTDFRWTAIPQCPLCRSERRTFIGHRGGPTHRLGLGEETGVYRCRDCGLIFCDPMPTPIDITKVYGEVSEYWEHDAFGGRLALRTLSPFLRPGATVLDVGAGVGLFVTEGRKQGFEVWGVEPSDRFRANADPAVRDFIMPGTIHDVPSSRRFDAIVLAAVIEHLPDPIDVLRKAASLLHPGGLIYVDTQNEDGIYGTLVDVYALWKSLRLRRRVCFRLAPTFRPFHIFGFSASNLRRALVEAGFAIKYRRLYPGVPRLPCSAKWVSDLSGQVLVRLASVTGTGDYMEYVGQRLTS
jgi:2-polyprenyl-3-methyl-5-hydroxy-6-metoxy-1,4-benzoquinol methylase